MDRRRGARRGRAGVPEPGARGRRRHAGARDRTACAASPSPTATARWSPRRPSRRSRTSTASRPTGASSSGTSTSTSRWACAWRSPTSRAAARSPAASAASGSSGATTASATRRRWSTRSRRWCATTASASSSWPTRSRPSTARSSSPFCEELIERKLPVLWGINTRVTDILRDEKLLPMFRKAGPDPRLARHRGGGAAEARPLQQGDHDRAEQEGDPAAARRRHRRPRRSSSSASRTRPPRRWRRPTGWRATGTPTWRTGRCTRPGRSATCSRSWATRSRCSTSRSTTSSRPIMKPDAMDRAELLDRVMNNYRRFFMNKTLLPVPLDEGQGPAQVPDGLPEGLPEERLPAHLLRPRAGRLLGPADARRRSTSHFDDQRALERPDAEAIAEADAGWVTMHGPKIEHMRRKGEENCRGGRGDGLRRRHRAARATSAEQRRRREPRVSRGDARRAAPRAASAPTPSPAWPRRCRRASAQRRRAALFDARRPAALPGARRPSRWSTRPRCARLHGALRETLGDARPRARGARLPAAPPPTICSATASRGRCRRC